jgi:branched-chain amino acid transport system substrate-binding protein
VTRVSLVLFCAALLLTGCGSASAASTPRLVIGALLPLYAKGYTADQAQEELNGINIVVDEVNRNGGIKGRRIELKVRDVIVREKVEPSIAELRTAGAKVVLGAYSTQLSIPAAQATEAAGLVYWETGAVADQVTGEGLPHVFRVGASGRNLGRGSATFAAEQLAPRLRKDPSAIRVSVVEEHDPYGDSVAQSAISEGHARGLQVLDQISYDAAKPDWDRVFSAVAAQRPDIVILASYVPDGVAFRHEMLARKVKVGALIGSTMAECGPDFGRALGADAVGVFASDRPPHGFNPRALDAQGRAAFDLLVRGYQSRFHKDADEEAISGFASAWALLHDVLPTATGLDRDAIAAAARAQDLADGSLPNGAGLRFATTPDELGQNLRAASVIWQWQGVNHSVTVWPPVFATGEVAMVPLPR